MASAINLSAQKLADRRATDDAERQRLRRITPEAGRALEILGHAIEYLTDEYMLEARELNAADPQLSAIRLLMSLNREVYYECPIAPSPGERIRALLSVDRD